MDAFEQELKQIFLAEATDLIEDVEQCFLSLEKGEYHENLISKIFRLVHSLKGSAKAVGFHELGDLTHVLESFLVRLRDKEVPVIADVITFLLESVDYISQMVQKLKENPETHFEIALWVERTEQVVLLAEMAKNVLSLNALKKEKEEIQEQGWGVFQEEEKKEENLDENHFDENHLEEQVKESFHEENDFLRNKEQDFSKLSSQNASSSKTSDDTIRVSLQRIDALINYVGELVILQTVLSQQKRSLGSTLVQHTVSQLEKITHEIRDLSMGLRMMPLKSTFQKMHRVVRDTASQLHKKIQLESYGEKTELDRSMIELLGDPLTHLIRNAIDHGIELPEERRALGKPEEGRIFLRAYQGGGKLILEIQDDGKGLDSAKILQKAIQKGMASSDQHLSENEIFQFIFHNGFSTSDVVSDVSGRGVGMDVVRTNIQALQGDIAIESQKNKGTCFKIILPLTLSIIDGFVVKIDTDRYVIPAANVFETIRPEEGSVKTISEKGEVLNLRGEVLSVYHLSSILGYKNKNLSYDQSIGIVVRDTRQPPYVMLVDDILAKQQIVNKKLGDEICNIPGFAGGAILGDGKPSVILDLNEMVEHVLRKKHKR